MFLFLDDLRISPEVVHNQNRGLGEKFGQSVDWFIVRNFQDFTKFVELNFSRIKFISFDHDINSWSISGNELTGKDAADWLVNYCIDNKKKLPDWFVHSDNSSGNKNIRQLFLNYMYRVEGRIDRMHDAYGYYNNKLIFTK